MLLEDLAIRCLKRLIQNDQLASSFDLKRAVKVSYGNGPMSKSAIDKLSAFKKKHFVPKNSSFWFFWIVIEMFGTRKLEELLNLTVLLMSKLRTSFAQILFFS